MWIENDFVIHLMVGAWEARGRKFSKYFYPHNANSMGFDNKISKYFSDTVIN